MALRYSNVYMDVNDLRTIEKVFANMDLDTKIRIEVNDLARSSMKLCFINESEYKELEKHYQSEDTNEASRLIQLNRFLWDLAGRLSFAQFLRVLQDSGYQNVCFTLLTERGNSEQDVLPCFDNSSSNVNNSNRMEGILTTVPKRRPPRAECLRSYYTKLKVLVDNNALPGGNRECLESGIKALDTSLISCRNPERRQFLLDKRVVLYFLLAQQYANCSERNNILQRMRDSMPQGTEIDRTTFDIIFHSYMAVNWASKGNDKTAAEHLALACSASSTCLPCLPTVVSITGAHFMHSEAYLHLSSNDHLQNASMDYENALSIVNEAAEEETTLWKSVIMLQMANLLLGIKMNLKVSEVEANLEFEHVKKARTILSKVRQLKGPLQNRRKMILNFSIGRLHEVVGNKTYAVKYIKKSLKFAENGSFDVSEKRNISEYLLRLQDSLA